MTSVALAYQKKHHARALADEIDRGQFDFEIDCVEAERLSLYRAIRREGYDIVQVDEALRNGAVATLATRNSSTKVVVDVQGWADYLNSHGEYGLLLAIGVKETARRVFRAADGVIFASRATKRELTPTFDFDDWRYAKPVFDSERYKKPTESQAKTKADQLLSVTNLRYEAKLDGIVTILDALLPIFEKFDCRYRIAGGGTYLSDLEAYVDQYEYSDRVEILGYREDIPDVLESADVFVYNSGLDSLGMVVLEAQAAGLPIIAGDCGGIPEAVGDEGIICPPNRDGLRQTIETLLKSQKLRRELSKQARARMETYGPKQVARHVEFWRSLLD